MKDFVIKVNNVKYKAKNLDDNFVQFVEEKLKESGVEIGEGEEVDNPVDKLFLAYLRLAGRYYKYEREIEKLIKAIDID